MSNKAKLVVLVRILLMNAMMVEPVPMDNQHYLKTGMAPKVQ